MIKQIVVCDVCGKQKQDVNHWWLVWINTDCSRWEIRPFSKGNHELEGVIHICGSECATKALNKFLEEIPK